MDPLSVAGSIGGLVSLGDAVFRSIYRYVKTVREAEKVVVDLKNEVIALTGIFHNLEIVAHELEQDDNFNNSVRVDHVNSCLATLYRLDDELKKIEYPKDQKIRTGLRKMAWPFKSGETKELREELQKHREVLTLALSADTTTALLKCLSVQGTMASDIHDIRMTLQKNEEIKTRIAMNDKRQHVLRYFLVTDPRENYKTSLSLRHPSTGFWLTEGETFRSWLRDEGSKIWLSGIPGAGKTVLSGLIIEQCIARSTADRAVAYYYCDYKNAKSQVTVNILSSLAAQLAIQHEGSFSLLEKYHESLHPPHQLENRPEIKELVVLLQNMAHSFEDVRLIIDGLDECGENTEEASEWLKALACEGQVSISLAVLSRDEPRIRDFLGPPICTHIEVAAQTKEIEHFVRTTIEEKSSKRRFRIKSPELKDEIIRTLVSKAQGMFRWVTCQLDHLCELSTDAQRRKALHELPATLNETYERILARVKPHDIPLVRRILLWTTYASPKLNINELLEVVSIEEDDECIDLEARIDEEQILQCCSSLIRKRAETFELAHFTVQEYLEKMGDVNLLDYQYSSNPALHLAQTCLTYLCFSDFDKPPPATVNDIDTRNTQHPFLEHATKFWLTYAAGYLDNFELYGQIQHLFQPKRSYNFISYAVSLFFFTSEYFTGRTEAFQQAIEMATAGDFGPLHVAALLGLKELCEWLLAEGYDVNQSSPIGTPIDCCIFGLEHSVWRGMELDKGEPDFGDDNVTNLTNLRLDAIIALLDAGANCKTEVRNGDSMGLAALYRFDHASIFSFLVKSGMPIEDDAMEFLQDTDSNVILKSLLQVIQDAADLNITIEQRNMILNLGILSEIETASSLLRDESISLEQFSDLAEGAIKFDQLEIFEALIEQSAFTVDMCLPGSDGTLLHMAARDHSIKVMQALLNFGFDPSRTTNDGHTVLYECVTLQNDNIMRRLIENPNCIRPDSFGRTVWHQAAWSGASRTLELLIEKYGASCSDAYLVSTNGESPLLEAIITGNETVSLLLLEVSKKNRKTIEDWRLVHYCIANGLSKVLDELVQLGVNLAVHSESQKSALHFLTKHTSLSSLETLLGQGLNPNEQDLHGKSALHTFLDGSRHAELDKAGVILNADCLTLPILERLVIPEGAILKDREGFMPWYYYCKKYVPRVLKTGPLHLQMFKRVGEMLTRRGAVAGFNKNQKVQSALSLLIEGCLDTIKPGLNLIAEPVSELHKAISDLLLSILKDHTLSSTTKGDVQLTRLLIWSIESHEDILCKALLIHGVEINARSTFWNGRNAIEAVCLVDNVEQHMFETILRYADIDSLNQNDWAGWSPIHHLSVAANANWKESSEKLETLLKFGADPNIRTRKDQFTAVNLAASKGHVEAFRSLLRHNAYIHLQTEYGWGVVAYAIASGSVDMMEELLEQIEDGALWKHKFSIAAPWDSSESLPLCSALHLAALVSEEILEILANSGHYQDFDETNRAGYTPLHLASSGPYRTTANWLISHGVDANAVTTNGMTALHFAVQSGNIRTVKALIVAGARFTPDKLGRSPEVLAPARALDDILRLLQELEVSDSVLQNLQTNEIAQELFSTIRLGNLDTCRLIIEKNESWKSLRSPECGICTALALALSAEHWGIVDLLLENSVPLSGTVCAKHFPSIFPSMLLVHVAIAKPEFNSRLQRFLDMLLTHQEHWVHSPLNPFHVAVYYNPASIDTLWSHIQKNGEILARNIAGQLPSGSNESLDVLKYLIGRRTPFEWSPIGNTFATGSTPLHLAAWTKQPKLVKKLISNGAETNAQDDSGWTPLHFSALVGCKDSVSLLLEHGANPTVRDNFLQTPLMVACKGGSVPVIDLLIVHEESKLAVDIQGFSALRHSVNLTGFEAFIYLLEAEWDPYQKTVFGESSIDAALSLPRFSTYILNADLDLEHLIPTGNVLNYPWIFFGNAHLLRLFLRRFPEVSRRRMVNSKYAMREHPFSRAARHADVTSMEAMIGAGVNIEVLDPTGRSPLINACLAGSLASVKLLIRKGAKLQYDFNGQPMNALEAAHSQEKVIEWLLVSRHTEHRRITNVAETEERILKCWSGVRELEVPIEGSFSRRVGESRLDWVIFVHAQKADWRRMVPLDWIRTSHIAPLFIKPAHSLDGQRV